MSTFGTIGTFGVHIEVQQDTADMTDTQTYCDFAAGWADTHRLAVFEAEATNVLSSLVGVAPAAATRNSGKMQAKLNSSTGSAPAASNAEL
jgi:hypothetical protein